MQAHAQTVYLEAILYIAESRTRIAFLCPEVSNPKDAFARAWLVKVREVYHSAAALLVRFRFLFGAVLLFRRFGATFGLLFGTRREVAVVALFSEARLRRSGQRSPTDKP